MKIRRLTGSDDLAGAIELLCRFFSEEGFDTAPETIAAHVRQLAGIEACGLFIAEDRGKTIGVATVSMEFGIEYGWWAEMGDLYLVPEYRGQGLSRQMVGAVETFLKDRGCSRLPGNGHAICERATRIGEILFTAGIRKRRPAHPLQADLIAGVANLDGDIVDEARLAEPGSGNQP